MSEATLPASLVPSDGRFGCGPSRVREAQAARVADAWRNLLGTSHRQAPVKDLVAAVQEKLGAFFNLPDGSEIVLGNGGSTAFWDAAAFGLIEERAQLASFGEFGGKFAKAAAAPWLTTPDVRRADPGSAVECAPAEGIDVYGYPQNETSTGAQLPVRRIDERADTLTLVDATSAAGGTLVDLRGIDAYYFAPQKNFGGDGGLWFAVMSERAVARAERIAASGRYIPDFLSLTLAIDNSRKHQTLNTPAIASLILLDAQLDWLLERGGMAWADARTRESSRIVYDWADAHEFATPFVAETQYRSQVVVTVDLDAAIDATAVTKLLRSQGIVDIEPYRKLGRNQLRVATFVSIEPEDVRTLTGAIDWAIDAAHPGK